jgi:hypothetical protein
MSRHASRLAVEREPATLAPSSAAPGASERVDATTLSRLHIFLLDDFDQQFSRLAAPLAPRRFQPRQSRRPRPASRGTEHRRVRQLFPRRTRTQQQPPAAHIPSPYKILRKQQRLPKNFHQRLHVLWGRNTPKQNHFRPRRNLVSQTPHIPIQRLSILRILRIHARRRDLLQSWQRHQLSRRTQSPRRRNNVHALHARGRIGKSLRIRQLPPKIKPANKTKHFPQRSPCPPQPLRQFESRFRIKKHLRANSRRIRRRQQKNPPSSRFLSHFSARRNFQSRRMSRKRNPLFVHNTPLFL